jgi:hypothetical protein
MQGAPKRQVNAEDMLAELKRALESSTRAPDATPPSASTPPKPRSPGRETGRSQTDNGSGRPAKANADKSTGPRTDLQKSTRPSSRSWKLIAGGLALAVAATICVSFAFMSTPSNLPEREPSVAATEGPGRPQNEQTLGHSMQDSQQAAPLQAGNLEMRPDARTAPVIGGLLPAGGKAEVDAPNLASSGLETAAPAFTALPLSQPATPVATQRIGPDGAPIATAPSSPASTESAHPAGTPKPAVQTAAPQMVKPDKASLGTAPPTPVSTDSAPPLAEAPKPAAPTAVPQMVKSNKASVATAPPIRASTDSAPPLAQTPKPNAMQTASVSNESAEPSTPKIDSKADSKKKLPEKISQQKPAKSAKASTKPIAAAERQSTEPARPKEAEKIPPPQDTGNPTAAAPVTKTTVQQRLADGMTHAFSYLMHLPGALVPHLGGPNPDAH